MTESDLKLLYLWNYRTLYIGEAFEVPVVKSPASCIVLGVEGDLELWKPEWEHKIVSRSVLIPAAETFQIDTLGKKIAICYLDPVGRDLSFLKTTMLKVSDGIYYRSSIEQKLIDLLKSIYTRQATARDAYHMLMEALFPADENSHHLVQVDDRIWKIIDIVKSDPTKNHSNQELADQVGLSLTQLRTLFKETTGISIRRYRTWHRLFITAVLMSFERTMTEAAIEAGFTDASHFNHAFKEMVGMKPSFVLKQSDKIRIFTGGDD